ncbi:hypothetical protein AAE02nite_39040 [Adhaeribacter aerolatus]|uniref:ABM domain-containing protein n=1 Tax=Adhaeribacter aerolatus TaxID=670289 RepID=A0A512B2Q7_9BACT|nr:antibiotic biosynthesis monooxygenase [Adhaeribacter aerolatus]GEO06240.1 hypothetical protein AAE02nite_39040 [Adhaeribacter aerolatus]
MFISLSSFTVANDMGQATKEAFINRPHLVDKAPGFIRMEVFTAHENPNEFWLMSYWENEESFKVWYDSHQYHDSHSGIPKGVKLAPKSVWVKYFNHVGD